MPPMHPRIKGILMGALCLFLLAMPSGLAAGDDPEPQINTPVSQQQNDNTIQQTGCSRSDYAPVNSDYEQQVAELVNQERAANSQPPLKLNSDLSYAARFHARDMSVDNYVLHDSYDWINGTLTKVCDWSTRVNNFYINWSYLGENIAAGQANPTDVMQAWMNSPEHKANILSPNFREFGVGFYTGSGMYSTYWAQDFGSRSSVYPLIINGEAAETDSTTVQLYIYGQGTWNEMRLRNDSDTWGDWQSFKSQLSWQLDNTAGLRTVSVELRKTGQSTGASSSDTIVLGSVAPALKVAPTSLNFLYDRSKSRLYPADHITLLPSNSGSEAALTWQISKNAGWVVLSATGGQTPSDSVDVSLDPGIFATDGMYDGTLTVTVTSPSNTAGSPASIPVHLTVVPDLPYSIFLPSIDG